MRDNLVLEVSPWNSHKYCNNLAIWKREGIGSNITAAGAERYCYCLQILAQWHQVYEDQIGDYEQN